MSYTIKLATGTYTGTGAVQNIAACDGADFVLTKRISGVDTVAYVLFRDMPRNEASNLGGTNVVKANQIIDLNKDGFAVGSGQSQSSANYIWFAIKSLGRNKFFETGRYVGNNTDNRNLEGAQGCLFTPDLMFLIRHVDGTVQTHRTSEHVGDLSGTLNSTAVINYIQEFRDGGFQIGTNSNVNNASDYYNWMAMRQIPGGFKVGSFTGTGVASDIAVGFQPDFLIVKNQDTNTNAWLREASMSISIPIGAAATNAQAITALTSTGFSVGTLADVNGLGNKIHYMAFKSGEYSPTGAK